MMDFLKSLMMSRKSEDPVQNLIHRAEMLLNQRLSQVNSVQDEITRFKNVMKTITQNVVNFMRNQINHPQSHLKDSILDLKNELSTLAADYSIDKKEFKAKAVKSVAFQIFQKFKFKLQPSPKFSINQSVLQKKFKDSLTLLHTNSLRQRNVFSSKELLKDISSKELLKDISYLNQLVTFQFFKRKAKRSPNMTRYKSKSFFDKQ